ncbi:hypothetical protein CDL12_17770 [Handroanthus impetiginosus]|uniref:Galactinol--sucrose galactosyltransferase n=1 Tax=Handroanthus impetiginosus TaxID=429701 RepID=A0A2G9GWJ4_9LAMI|nr:hypothetical protein CDL12_17770 [Handroanthus impetiginosus]
METQKITKKGTRDVTNKRINKQILSARERKPRKEGKGRDQRTQRKRRVKRVAEQSKTLAERRVTGVWAVKNLENDIVGVGIIVTNHFRFCEAQTLKLVEFSLVLELTETLVAKLVTVEGHLQTFCHRKGKKFVILDDGWQFVGMDPTSEEAKADNTAKLTNINENHNFQKDGKEGQRVDDPAMGIKHIVTEIRDQHSVKYFYVWHALTRYWAGVKPGVAGMEHYESKLAYPLSSPEVQLNEPGDALNSITKNGLGLVNSEKNELHSYVSLASVDGVKVDVQNILETLGAGRSGRVKLVRKYHQALEASISRNFPDNGIISCMSHNTDSLYRKAMMNSQFSFLLSDQMSSFCGILLLASDIYSCSDKAGEHDFKLLKKLVLPDGSILRARLPGRPTYDCLLTDPARDGNSSLKIWNLNDHTGVELSNNIAFAPVGLVKMFSSGGAIKELGKKLNYETEKPRTVDMKVRGCGMFGAYSSVRPTRIQVDAKEVEFDYEKASGFVKFALQIPEKEMYLWNVIVEL